MYWIKISEVSEEKLLAGIAYGEASTRNNYEEMAGIASAVLRKKDALRTSSVNDLVKKQPNFSYVTHDGYDLKTSGSHHKKYREGFIYTKPDHNIFSTDQPVLREMKGNFGVFEYTYESTAAYGRTIFWKLSNEFLKASGAKQCI